MLLFKGANNMSLSEKIKEQRLKHGWTQEELADMLGVACSTVCKHEKSDRGLYPEMIARYMRIFGVDANYLFRDYALMENMIVEDSNTMMKYSLLDFQGKRVVENSINGELSRVEAEQDGEFLKRPFMKDLSSYKETGILEVNECLIRNTVFNRKATSAALMPDDSMAPRYPKGTKLLLENAHEIKDGETGIFMVNHEILIRRKEKDQIVAEDPSYKAIAINADCVCMARVLGKEEK